jgi:hypothetical protein
VGAKCRSEVLPLNDIGAYAPPITAWLFQGNWVAHVPWSNVSRARNTDDRFAGHGQEVFVPGHEDVGAASLGTRQDPPVGSVSYVKRTRLLGLRNQRNPFEYGLSSANPVHRQLELAREDAAEIGGYDFAEDELVFGKSGAEH